MSAERPLEAGACPVGRADRHSWRGSLVWLAILAAVGAGIYLPTLGNGFVFDDQLIVVFQGRNWENESLWSRLKTDYWGDRRIDLLYRPVTSATYLLNYRWSGDRPECYRAVNIVLHAACCCCLFGLSCALFGDRRLAGLAAAVFAVHALHVEAVVQIVGRAELLAALCALLALWLYVADAQRRQGRPTWRYPVALSLMALSMFSKESGIAVIGLAAFYDVWSVRFDRSRQALAASGGPAPTPHARGGGRVIARVALHRWVAMLVVVAVVLAIRVQVLGQLAQSQRAIGKMDNPVAHASTIGRALTPVVLLGKYVGLLIWPHPLCHDYSYNAIPICETPLDLRFGWGVLCISAMAVGAALSYRGRGVVLWAVVFFVLSYALISNTLVLSGTIFAERLMYLPSVGFCWLVALVGIAAADRIPDSLDLQRSGWWVMGPIFAVLCSVHVLLTVRRGAEWKSERALVASALRVTDQSVRIDLQAGTFALHDKDLSTAIRHFERAVQIMDDHMFAHFHLGRACLMTGEPLRAIRHLRRCVGRLPAEANHAPAQLLGQAYRDIGMPDEAAHWFTRAEQLKRKHPPGSKSLFRYKPAMPESAVSP